MREGRQEMQVAQYYVLSCIIARTIKNEMRELLRNVLERLEYSQEATVRNTVVAYLNFLFSGSDRSKARRIFHWRKKIIPRMKQWFHTNDLPLQSYDVLIELHTMSRDVIGISPKSIILHFVATQLCMDLSKLAHQKVLKVYQLNFIFLLFYRFYQEMDWMKQM
jgi:hypothetical protein